MSDLRLHTPAWLRRALVALTSCVLLGAAAGLTPIEAVASPQPVPAATENTTGATPQGRIVGGSRVTVASVPWQVYVWSGGEEGFSCGGSILDATTILTAAHCVAGVTVGAQPEDGGLGVWAGVSNVDAPEPSLQSARVIALRVHPSWNPDPVVETSGDLAVLTITPALSLNGSTVKAIALPPNTAPVDFDPIPAPTGLMVSGFGVQFDGLDPDGSLWALPTAAVDPDVCDAYDNAIALCARTALGTSCQGDSGGPLVATGPAGTVQVGVVSNGPLGCTPGDPDSYLNLLAPENLLWLRGMAQPPVAPRQTSPLTIGAKATLGAQAITCGGGGWTGSPVVKWTFTNDAGTTLATIRGGTSARYEPTPADAGRAISCRASAGNDGGVAVAGPVQAVGPVAGGGSTSGTTLRPVPTVPQTAAPAFRLSEAALSATAVRAARRGQLLRIKVTLDDLFGSAQTGSVCVRTAKPVCVSLALTGQASSTATFRVRIPRNARRGSTKSYRFVATVVGRNPSTGLSQQVTVGAVAAVKVARR